MGFIRRSSKNEFITSYLSQRAQGLCHLFEVSGCHDRWSVFVCPVISILISLANTSVDNVNKAAGPIPESGQSVDTEDTTESDEHETQNSTAETCQPSPDGQDLGPKSTVQVDYPSDESDVSSVSDLDE
jgi:hypothetical protein